MNSHTGSHSQAQQNAGDQGSDGRYVRAGAAVMAGTAAGTVVALWLFPMVVFVFWTGMLIMLGLMTFRPTAASATR